ncbi:glycosyltransferase [Beijerinckia indica]|uniref:Glycosyl transferase family 2 n=1 Tax=Beijerinckia indica subsp. indica (strain ATCC 9039 / DSM 1715 / NCIMB 8712) TaxID=395963 RepID=B2IE76_BEII9|nr:glycosyltransferase family 2 protein [Beijerinckia indica]ACB94100.1 glycosyl transferase family 2 [Beijerinckia indica subsp. indica ATCC 9039]
MVIVPVKGAEPTTRSFFAKLRGQSYEDFHILAAIESAEDPAFELIASLPRSDPQDNTIALPQVTAVIAGKSEYGGQKVANLLAALDHIDPCDDIVVFTDADTWPDPHWLERLVAALVNTNYEAVTGYRWMVPTNSNLATQLVAAANTSIVTLPRLPEIANMCWGGTMALRRETLEKLDLRRYWTGAVSDDLQMTRACADHGIKIFSPRESLLLSPISFTWQSALAFGTRQYRIIFTHAPLLWTFAAFCLLVPILAAVLACLLAVRGDIGAIAMLAIAMLAGEIRFWCRRRIATALWQADDSHDYPLTSRADRLLRPLWWMFHALCILAAPWSRRIKWAGIDYLIKGPQDVSILHRDYPNPSGQPKRSPCEPAGHRALPSLRDSNP